MPKLRIKSDRRGIDPFWHVVCTPRNGGSDIIFTCQDEETAKKLFYRIRKGRYPNINMDTCSRIETRRVDLYTVWSRLEDAGYTIYFGGIINEDIETARGSD